MNRLANTFPAEAPVVPSPELSILSGREPRVNCPSGLKASHTSQVTVAAMMERLRNTIKDQPIVLPTIFSEVRLRMDEAMLKKTSGMTITNIKYRNSSPRGLAIEAAGPKNEPHSAPASTPRRSSIVCP